MISESTRPAGERKSGPVDWLVCVAVKEEIAGFNAPGRDQVSFATVITGMGLRNASKAIQYALKDCEPRHVITSGFAGGLNPGLKRGTVVFDADAELGIAGKLRQLGAVPAKFHCASRIAITAADKSRLRSQTDADVVEMESSVIRELCREARVLSATIRVVSDSATDDLPLDFNALMTSDDRINWWKFARTIALKPRSIGRLMAFQRQTRAAAKELGRVLEEVLRPTSPTMGTQGVP